jgi:leucyl aminopeptidase (aminopeptidase T)
MRTPILAAAMALAASVAAGQSPAGTPGMPDMEELAERVVADAAGVREGDIVLLEGHRRDAEFLESLALRARAAGAFPLLSYTSDRLERGKVDSTPERLDSRLSTLDVRLASMADAVITIDATDDPGLLNHVPAARLAERAKADAAIEDLYRRARVRRVRIGGGLYPTAAAANQYTLTQDELSGVFWGAVAAEGRDLRATGAMVKWALSRGAEARITNPNGTDIKFRIKGRPVIVSDGAITPQEAARGELEVWLPAGEVLVTPVPGSAEGRVVVDLMTHRGVEVTALNVQVRGGKVSSISARIGGDAVRRVYDASGPGKEQLSYLSIGINPRVRLPEGVKPGAPSPLGMLTLGLGNNARAGGENTGPFALALCLPGSTLLVDGRPLVESGRLVMPADPEDPGEPAVPDDPPRSP